MGRRAERGLIGQAFELCPRASWVQSCLLGLVHGGLLGMLYLSALSPLLQGLLALPVTMLWWRAQRASSALQHERLLCQPGGTLMRYRGDGRVEGPFAVSRATDFGWVVWLAWVHSDGPQRYVGLHMQGVMLTADRMPAPQWRRLRVWVRHGLQQVGRDDVRKA